MDILTLTQNQTIKIAKYRDIKNLTISYEDREILNEIQFNSFVGVVELKNNLLIEILPNFENSDLLNNKILNYREKFLNIVLLLNSNLNNSTYIFSKDDLKKLPLNEALIYLVLNTLSNELINLNDSIYLKNSSKIIDSSLQIFKFSIYILSKREANSYLTKFMLDDLLNSLNYIQLIEIDLSTFDEIILDNNPFKTILIQLKFIISEYLPYYENRKNYWSLTYEMNHLFKIFFTSLLKRNLIKFQNKKLSLFDEKSLEVLTLKDNEDIIECKFNFKNFDELSDMFIYMSLKDVNGYVIVPKSSKIESRVIEFITKKSLTILNIDFSLNFDELIDIKISLNENILEITSLDKFNAQKERLISWFYESGINITNLNKIKNLKLSKTINSLPKELELLNLNSFELIDSKLTELPQHLIDSFTNLKEIRIKGNFDLLKLPNLANLKNLEVVEIGANMSIYIEIPNYIYNLTNLRELNLSKNSITSLKFLEPIESLEKLILRDNSIESYLIKSDNLKILDLSNNNLEYIFDFNESLEDLDLSNNKLKNLTSKVTNLLNLEKLNISKNELKNLPLEIGKLKNLKELDLSYNRLTELPFTIENLINLEYIYLSGNYFAKFPNEIIKLMMKTHTLKVIIEKEEFGKSIPYHLLSRVL